MSDISRRILNWIYKHAEKNKIYVQRIAGDNHTFRYPHLSNLKDEFIYDQKNDVFIAKTENKKKLLKVIDKISANEITVYELMNKKAKKLHLYDFLGYKATSNEKLGAFISVTKDYILNKIKGKWKKGCNIYISHIDKCNIASDFDEIYCFINKFRNIDMIIATLDNHNTIFQFGSTLKGTNIIFVDKNLANIKQEVFHLNYHVEEGIRGFNDDNINIIEKWASVPWLYLLQLLNGRLERRVRKSASPHDIKFLDYVFLRAYIGKAFEPPFIKEDKDVFHSVFAIIEPSVKLLMHSLDVDDQKLINSILINAICYDKCDVIKAHVNTLFGDDAFESIYFDYNLFNRIKTINSLIEKKNMQKIDIYKKMFSKQKLLRTLINCRLVALIWFSEKLNTNKDLIIDLIEDYSLEHFNQYGTNAEITIEEWSVHVNKRFGRKLYNTIIEEYEKVEEILEVLE